MSEALVSKLLETLPTILTSLAAVIVAWRSSRKTRRRVKELADRQDAKEVEIDRRMAACEKIHSVTPFSNERQFHEHYAIEHLRAVIQAIPDDMPQPPETDDV